MPYRKTILSPADLVTPYEQTRAGFLKIALEKNRVATPYVDEAKALKTAVSHLSTPKQLLKMAQIRGALLTASGLSDKALRYLTDGDKQDAITHLIEQFLEPAGNMFVDELLFRFLLTRGDSLGGKMRNLAGKLAEQTLIRAMIATLSIQEKQFSWFDARSKQWLDGEKDDPQIAQLARGLYWQTNGDDNRTLLFNLTVPIVTKNVDLCLLDATPHEIVRGRNKASKHHQPDAYIALGELKGGIDPAGADEHWKTANSALSRVRTAFDQAGCSPSLFFIGAAIAEAMAQEIYNQLQCNELINGANLTNEDQLFMLTDWLIRL